MCQNFLAKNFKQTAQTFTLAALVHVACVTQATGVFPTPDTEPLSVLAFSDAAGGAPFVLSVLLQAIEADPKQEISYILNVNSETRREVEELINKHPQAKKLAANVYFTDSTKGRWNWQQDMVQGFSDPVSGKTVVRGLGKYYGGQHDLLMGEMLEIFARIGEKNGTIQVGAKLDVGSTGPLWGHMGGNIEGLPGGFCLLGDDGFSAAEFDAFGKEICGGDLSRVVKIPTGFLDVGHADEIFKVIPINDGTPEPCNFAFLMASPAKAMELLKERPSDKVMSFSTVSASVSAERAIDTTTDFYKTCADIFVHRASQQVLSPDPSKPTKGPSIHDQGARLEINKFLNSGLSDLIYFVIGSSSAQAESSSGSLSPANANFPCSEISNSDFLKAIQADAELLEFNKMVEKELSDTQTKISALMKKRFPQCRPQFIKVPNLFTGRPVQLENGKKTIYGANARSYFPNPANGISINNAILVPDPGNASFEKYLTASLSSLGLKTKYIDTFFAHKSGGNLHCSVATIGGLKSKMAVSSPADKGDIRSKKVSQ